MPNPKDPWAPPLQLRFSVPKKKDVPWATKKWPTLAELSWPEQLSSPRLSCTAVQLQLPIAEQFGSCGDRLLQANERLQKFTEFQDVAGRAEVPVWVVAGLDGVAVVQKHEKERKQHMQKLREDRDDEAQTAQQLARAREEIAELREQLRLATSIA